MALVGGLFMGGLFRGGLFMGGLFMGGLFMATRAASCMQQLMPGAVDVCRPLMYAGIRHVVLTCLTCLSVVCGMSHGVACIGRLMRLSDVMISPAHYSDLACVPHTSNTSNTRHLACVPGLQEVH